MECAEDFAKANSPEDLFEKQCSFARQAARQYAEETSKLIGMFARIQQSCWAPMEACTKAALHGIDGAVDGEEKRSEEHTSELQSLMRISYAVLCLKTKIDSKKT